jgi:RNA polymerase sigma-70 factor (ECF subfamily)
VEVGISCGPSTAQAAARGVEVTVEALLRTHFDDVYRWVGRMLGPGALAPEIEAVAESVFLAAHKRLLDLRPGEQNILSWLRRLSSRVVLVRARSFRHHRRWVRTLRSRTDADPELVRAWKGLLQISAERRLVYLLHEVEGLSGADISAALDIPTEEVFKKLYRARTQLVRAR